MTTVAVVAFGGLGVAGILSLARLLRPGTIAERIVALDTMLLMVIAGIGVHAMWTRSGMLLDALVVASLLVFAGTVTVARFIEKRGL